MNKKEKGEFVRDLSRALTQEVLKKIEADRIPADWDGHELRCYLRDLFTDQAEISAIVKEPRGKRAKAYRNTKHIESWL